MIDWHIPISTILLACTTIAAVIKSYFGLKADNAKGLADTKADIAKISADLVLGLMGIRSEMKTGDADVKENLLGSINKLELDIKDVSHRVGALEQGKDEWTKSIRERVHELSNQMGQVILQIDRLERPAKAHSQTMT